MATLKLIDLTGKALRGRDKVGNPVVIHYSSYYELAKAIAQERPSMADGFVRREMKENEQDSIVTVQYYGFARQSDALPCEAWKSYRPPVFSRSVWGAVSC